MISSTVLRSFDTAPCEASTNDAAKVLLIDDERLVCEALAEILRQELGLDTSCAFSTENLQKQSLYSVYDLVILDVRMPEPLSLSFIRGLLAKIGRTPLLLSAEVLHRDFLAAALELGAQGMVLKSMPLSAFLNAANMVIAGAQFAPAETSKNQYAIFDEETKITHIERAALISAAQGLTDKEISIETNLPLSRVKNIQKRVRDKLSAVNRAQSVRIALEKGII